MSTTMNDASTFSGSLSGTSPRVRLPGEDDHIDAEIPHAPVPDAEDRLTQAARPQSRKAALLSTAAMVFLIGAASVMSYMRHAEFEHIPMIQRALVALHISGVTHPAGTVVAGSPATAATHVQVPRNTPIHAKERPTTAPAHTGMPQAAQLAAAPTVPAKAGTTNPKQTQLAQFEAFKPGPSSPAAPASESAKAVGPHATSATPGVKVAATASASSSAAPGPAVRVPGSPPSTAAPQVKGAVPPSAAAPGKVPSQPTPAKPAPVTLVANPVAQAVVLKAGPMSSEQQINVLHLVTELGVLVRDQRTEIALLREQVADVSGKVKGELADFDRRLSIAEADGAINAAMGAGETVPVQKSAASLAVPATPAPAATRAAQAALPPLVRHVSDYHIQAASPGLAMLTTTIDGGSRVTVGVGDEVPGVGRVRAVFQNGTRWVVQTDHGVIKQ